MNNKYTEDDYCDLFSKKICDNCGKCLEEQGVDIRAINIEDIAKNVEENDFIEDELKKALAELEEEKHADGQDEVEEYNIDLAMDHEDEDYVDAFDNVVYLDEVGIEFDDDLEEMTTEIYPGIRTFSKKK